MQEVLSWGGSSAAEPCREMELVHPSHGGELSQGCFNSEQCCRGQNPMAEGKLDSFAAHHAWLLGL